MTSNSDRFSDETLLGFLMNSLPEDQQQLIDETSKQDEALRNRIEDLRSLLIPLEATIEEFEPRSGLVSETMEFIADQRELIEERKPVAALSSPLLESAPSTRLAWLDSLVTLVAGIVLLTILLPSIWYSRESARRIGCSDNLRNLSEALTSFASLDSEGRLPRIEQSGPLSFAGVYAIRLKEADLLPSSSWLWCPSSADFETKQTVPSMDVYLASSPDRQRLYRYTSGGTYAFSLGNFVDGIYLTPRRNGRSYLAVLGDVYTRTEGAPTSRQLHAGNSCNVLYDDGRIQLVRVDLIDETESLDHPYRNRDHKQKAGIGPYDSSLGPSYQSPFVTATIDRK